MTCRNHQAKTLWLILFKTVENLVNLEMKNRNRSPIVRKSFCCHRRGLRDDATHGTA
jgi:hypothetical protein